MGTVGCVVIAIAINIIGMVVYLVIDILDAYYSSGMTGKKFATFFRDYERKEMEKYERERNNQRKD